MRLGGEGKGEVLARGRNRVQVRVPGGRVTLRKVCQVRGAVTSAAWELKGEAQRGPRCQETQEPGPLRRVFSQNLEKNHTPTGERSIMAFLLGT